MAETADSSDLLANLKKQTGDLTKRFKKSAEDVKDQGADLLADVDDAPKRYQSTQSRYRDEIRQALMI